VRLRPNVSDGGQKRRTEQHQRVKLFIVVVEIKQYLLTFKKGQAAILYQMIVLCSVRSIQKRMTGLTGATKSRTLSFTLTSSLISLLGNAQFDTTSLWH
jgi:hypothetical protein